MIHKNRTNKQRKMGESNREKIKAGKRNITKKSDRQKMAVCVGKGTNYHSSTASATPSNCPPITFENFNFIFRFAERLTAIGLRRDFSIHRSAAAITDRAVGNKLTKHCAPLLLCPIKLTKLYSINLKNYTF